MSEKVKIGKLDSISNKSTIRPYLEDELRDVINMGMGELVK